MTVIAVYITNDGAVGMAADSRSSSENGFVYPGTTRKIFRLPVGRHDEALLGVAGIHGLGDKAARSLNLPAAPEPTDDDECNSWAQAIAEAVYDVGAAAPRKLLDHDGDLDAISLLAHAGRAWYLTARALAFPIEKYFTIGSGDDHALGAMEALLEHAPALAEPDPTRLLRAAIETACRFRSDCAPPIFVEVLRPFRGAIGEGQADRAAQQ